MYDLILSGGMVIDGTGQPRRRADVAVQGSRIAAIGNLDAAVAKERIDVAGQVVSPGFIDIHTHSDLPLLINPRAESKIRQGVTTEVIGNCGYSPAPLDGPHRDQVRQMSSFLAKGAAALPWDWNTLGDYIARLEAQGTAVNVAPLAGHVTIRAVAMGTEKRPPTDEELELMKKLVRGAMQDGAFGFSTGLVYPPSAYADTDEVVALAKVAAEHGGIYFTHIRNENNGLLRAVAEAIEIGERAGAPVQIAHHKAQPFSWGRMPQALTLSEWAQDRGHDVTCDVYPYTAGSTTITQCLPEWALSGGSQALLARLADPQQRARIRAESENAFQWDTVYISWVGRQENKWCEGKNIAEIAEEWKMAPVDAAMRLTEEVKTQASIIRFQCHEDDVRYVVSHPLSMFGSDGSSLAPYGPLGDGKPHPRNYGTFARALQVYVREQNALSLEEGVRKMTGAPAAKLGLKDKGVLREGADADITVFDPAQIAERGTYADPHQYATGISYVLVNGAMTIRQGEHTGALAGKVLRRP